MSKKPYQDSSGQKLADYVRPSVAVDTAALTLEPRHGLVVLQVRRSRGPGWALPGTFLHDGETLADAVDRSLHEKANVRGLRPRQLHVFDDPKRDDRGWVLSVAHVDVVRLDRLESRFNANTRLMPVGAPGLLPFDHPSIVERAVRYLRARYADTPDPDGLLGDAFTLRDLQIAHEAVLGESLQRDSFRRKMSAQLVPMEAKARQGRGRPADLFRRAVGLVGHGESPDS